MNATELWDAVRARNYMARQIGGDHMAMRTANILCRNGFYSIDQLNQLHSTVGRREFVRIMTGLDKFGPKCLERLLDHITKGTS